MAYDRNTVPRPTLVELLRGIEREDGSIADMLCTRREVDSFKGTIPVLPSTASQPDGSDDEDAGVVQGAELTQSDQEYDDVNYLTLRYGDSTTLRDDIVASLDSTTGVDSLEIALKKIRDTAHKKIDLKLQSVIDDTSTLNLTANVTSAAYSGAAWDDGGSTSKPLSDILVARRQVPGADTMFIGLKVADALRAHPDFIAETSNISAGQLGDGEVASLVARKFSNIQNVVIGNTFWSNQANEGQAVDTGFDLNDSVWLGYKRDLIMCEFGSPHSETQRIAKQKSEILTYERSIDILRPHKEMGIVFTNTLT